MRDPAVLAVFALRVTAAEFATLASGAPIVRPYWPPVPCRGSVVGLQVGGEVLGEALISGVVAVAGATAWRSASGGGVGGIEATGASGAARFAWAGWRAIIVA